VTNRAKRPWHVRLLRRVRLDYLKILRTEGAPTQVARGVGYGIFVELLFFPSLGLAFILMYPLNRWCAGHMAASVAGFVFTKLFAWATIPPSILVGKVLIGSEKEFVFQSDTLAVTLDSLKRFYTEGQLWEFLLAWNLGAAIFGAVLGLVGFVLARGGLRRFQERRRRRRELALRTG